MLQFLFISSLFLNSTVLSTVQPANQLMLTAGSFRSPLLLAPPNNPVCLLQLKPETPMSFTDFFNERRSRRLLSFEIIPCTDERVHCNGHGFCTDILTPPTVDGHCLCEQGYATSKFAKPNTYCDTRVATPADLEAYAVFVVMVVLLSVFIHCDGYFMKQRAHWDRVVYRQERHEFL